MFGSCDPKDNGEVRFFNSIKDNIRIIFDVGSSVDSEYLNFSGEVHYFEPASEYYRLLSAKSTKNSLAHFNNFGLSDEKATLYYYPAFQSFYDRVASCNRSDAEHKIELRVNRGDTYIKDEGIHHIDFMKIDTEGYEMKVLKGFGDFLSKIKIIQFEYGGTYIDSGVQLSDVVTYLQRNGFHKFAYLTSDGVCPITDFSDHYQYCNIVCINRDSDIVPY